jgi:hypothetical protein
MLAACSKTELSGTYSSDSSGVDEKYGADTRLIMEFMPNNKVNYIIARTETDATYTIDGKVLKLLAGGKTTLWDIGNDGNSLTLRGGVTISKIRDDVAPRTKPNPPAKK